MVRALVRPVAAVLLIPLTIQLTACYGPPREVPATRVEDPEEVRIVGVITVEGQTVPFDDPGEAERGDPAVRGVHVRSDTLYASVEGEPYSLPADRIHSYLIRYPSTGRTIALVAGVVVGALAVFAAIALALKESCPFIYSWDGSRWVFDAEPYGGATTRGLERDDYSELEHLVAVDGVYRLKVTNEVPETQHTDLAELVVVDHPPGTRVVADERGEMHAVRSLVPPLEARDDAGRDLTEWLRAGDRLVWEPLPEPGAAGDRSEITLTFPKPTGARRATLVARVGTGIWGSYMIKAMLELHGSELGTWYAALDERPSAVDSLVAWNLREELYGLKVLVEEPGGWTPRGLLHGGGPFILEDRPVVLDVSAVAGDRLQLQVRPPRGFWSLDAFAVSYDQPEAPIHVQRLRPRAARDQRGQDLLAALSEADDAYHSMPSNDDRAELAFDAPPEREGWQRTIFLHSQGWYRIHLDDTGPPDRETLRRIADVPGAAARYAAERFAQWSLARLATEESAR